MAITINTTPNAYNSTYRHLEWKVTSGAAGITRMKASIFINNVELDSTTPVIQDPDVGETDEFTFDLQELAADQTTNTDIQVVDGDGQKTAVNSWKDVKVKFTEVLLSGGVLIDGATITGTNVMVLTGVLQYTESDNYDTEGYLLGSITKKWLTNHGAGTVGNGKLIGRSDSEYLAALTDSLSGNHHIEIQTYNEAQVFIAGYLTENFTPSDVNVYGVGPGNVNNWTLQSGAQPIIVDSVHHYVVNHAETGAASTSEQFWFKIDPRTTYKNSTRFHFQDVHGHFSSVTFTGRHTEGLKVTESDYEAYLASGFAIKDRGTTQLRVGASEKFSCYSRVLEDAELRWLKELYTSVNVYVQSGTNLLPVIITNKSDWEFDSETNWTPQLKIEYVYANQIWRQRA